MTQESFDPKLIALESALASLAPAAGAINRDKLFFHAGQRAASRRGWLWPCATLTLALVSAAAMMTFVFILIFAVLPMFSVPFPIPR